jgi:hypothetical protein
MEEKAIRQIRDDRDLAAERALEALVKLRRSVDETAEEIARATSGHPARRSFFVPNRQYLSEVVEFGSQFEALWYATGYAEGEGAR